MTQKSQEAFEAWCIYHEVPAIAEGYYRSYLMGAWQASRESLKQELMSDEMVEKVANAIEAGYVQNKFGATEYAKAALQAVVEFS